MSDTKRIRDIIAPVGPAAVGAADVVSVVVPPPEAGVVVAPASPETRTAADWARELRVGKAHWAGLKVATGWTADRPLTRLQFETELNAFLGGRA